MPQCPALTSWRDSPARRYRCVMEEGHAPLGTVLGQKLTHNFGGLGPYTPRISEEACRGTNGEPRTSTDGDE